MAITGQRVFELALTLIDEVTISGKIDLSDPLLKAKAPKIITILQAELLPGAGEAAIIETLTEELILNANQCLLVLPYGLAAHLAMQDVPDAASFFQERYEELKRKKKAKIKPILAVNDGKQYTNDDFTVEDGTLDGGVF